MVPITQCPFGLRRPVVGFALRMVFAFVLCSVFAGTVARSIQACRSHFPPVDCLKSASLTKGIGFAIPNPNAPTLLAIPVLLTTKTQARPGRFICPVRATVLGGTFCTTIKTFPGGITVATGTSPIPSRGAGLVIRPETAVITLPPLPNGIYTIVVDAKIDFSADSSNLAQSYTVTGDTRFCLVETLPGGFTPRLNLFALSSSVVGCGPGAQFTQSYCITNNDPINSVSLNVTATTRQNARMPIDPGNNPGVPSNFSISDPNTGDDFPICFVEDLDSQGNLPLPPDPSMHVQGPITKAIVIPPLTTTIIEVETRSYTECADGSCAETLFVVEGTFADATPALACIGGGITVDRTAPPCPNASLCPDGTVDTGNGSPVDVLFVNGSTGGATRTVTVPTRSPITVGLNAAPAGPVRANYVLLAWLSGPANPFELRTGGELVGCFVNQIPLNATGNPQPFRCIRGGLPASLCAGVTEINGPGSAPFSLTRNQGLARPLILTLQALLQDNGANNTVGLSATNAVTLMIQ